MEKDKKHILLVEDDKLLQSLLGRKLENEGFSFEIASNGSEVFEKLETFPAQLIFLDLVLSGMDGFQILEKLKKDEATKDIPVVVLSNLGQDSDIKRSLELGAIDHMIKADFTPQEIIAKAKSILGE